MGVRGVRLYHDQALYKEAGGGFRTVALPISITGR